MVEATARDPTVEATLTQTPRTQYARSGKYHIAYQVFGDGPFDLVFAPGFVSHVEMAWEEPKIARGLRRLASFARVIVFDKRGTGLSDRVSPENLPIPEDRMDDVRCVMDAASSERAVLLGSSEGGWMCSLFAATFPSRTIALVLHAAYPRSIQDEDFPQGWLPREQLEDYALSIRRSWTEGNPGFGGPRPGVTDDEATRLWFARAMRSAASPGAAEALMRMDFATDIRLILPLIRVPTLLTIREGDENLPATRYMAEKIPGARLKVFPGNEHGFFFGEQDEILGEIEEFLTGVRREPESERVLATVLFTDIVGSTERAAALGDLQWKKLLDAHDAALMRQVERYRGRLVKSTGDGCLATFDGPGRAIQCALEINKAMRELGLDIRSGLHTGEIEMRGEDIAGIAVVIAARVMAESGPADVYVSSSIPPLVAGSGIEFEDLGARELKGVPGDWRLLAVKT